MPRVREKFNLDIPLTVYLREPDSLTATRMDKKIGPGEEFEVDTDIDSRKQFVCDGVMQCFLPAYLPISISAQEGSTFFVEFNQFEAARQSDANTKKRHGRLYSLVLKREE